VYPHSRMVFERGLTSRWRFREPAPGPAVPPSSSRDGLEPLVQRVLAARNLLESDAGSGFLHPSLLHLHDPSLIPDLDRGADRILAALRKGERIAIYGDYDVDGITATAILFHTLKGLRADADLITYVPHRLEEGYGLNEEAISSLADAGARVIISVDCGVTAVSPAIKARDRGVDLIITDHHNVPACEADLPAAYAVVHPRRPGSTYPFGDLSGAGVAYKLAWRLATLDAGGPRVHPAMRALLVDLLAFAALGTIADVVPLIGENRVIARFGLQRIKHCNPANDLAHPLRGLRALVESAGLAGERVDAFGVGFRLAPRLNAAGRMGHARDAVELFTTAEPTRAAEIAAMLTQQNTQRRSVEREIFEQAQEMAAQAGMTGPERRAVVLADERWHAGVVGIVCSRLVERFSRPAILMQRRDGLCHGSGRSIDGFDLHEALGRCARFLEKFGGHDMAAGLTVRDEHLGAFTEAFTAIVNESLKAEDLLPSVQVDCEASVPEMNVPALDQLERLSPFGRSNPEVCVLVRGVQVASPAQNLGESSSHLGVHVRQAGTVIRLLGWGWGERRESFRPGLTLDLVLKPRLSRWNGRTSVEPEICDARVV